MIRKMLIASALAGTMALTSVAATPAIAAPDAEDIAKTALGLIVLGAIVSAANDQDRRRDEVSRGSNNHNDDYRDDGRWGGHRRDSWRILPARCEFETRTRRGWADVFGRRCLSREGVNVNRLPDRCEFEIRTDRGERTVYGKRCLEDRGYRVEARRRR
jgi:hypothetical protein